MIFHYTLLVFLPMVKMVVQQLLIPNWICGDPRRRIRSSMIFISASCSFLSGSGDMIRAFKEPNASAYMITQKYVL